jgi:cysteine desulfurase
MAGILSFGLKAQELRESQGVCPHGEHSFRMRALFAEKLSGIPGAVVHGPLAGPGSNTVNFHVEGVLGQDLMIQCDLAGIAVSNGSACSAGVPKPSRTLLAMGYTPEQAQNSLRISFGGATTQAHLEEIYRVICMVSCKS